MAYSEQKKNEIKKRLLTESVKAINEDTKIPVSTLYKWKKENAEVEEEGKEERILEEIKTLKRAKKVEEAIKLISKYPNNQAIQAQMMSIYIKRGEYEKAKEIGERFKDYPPIQSQMIKIHMQERNYKKAEEIGAKFKDNPLIQSQMVTIYIKEGNYEKAKKIGAKFEDDPSIQSQMITIYIKEGNYQKAKETGERFKGYPPIQSQIVTIYIKGGNYRKAKKIGSRFEHNLPIQSQMVTIYIKEGNYEKAKEIGERFKDYPPIQSQIVTIYIREGEYERAKEIGERFKSNPQIQSQMSTIYINEGNYKKAKEICARFENNLPIQSQMVTIYIQEGNYEKAKEIGERFKGYPPIQSQMITICIKEGNYEKAKEIGERFKDNPQIKSQMVTICAMQKKAKQEQGEATKKKIKLETSMMSKNNSLRKRIYYEDDLDIDETIKQIEQSYAGVDTWTLTLIKIALTDRTNKTITMQNIINKYIKDNPEEKEHIKILKQIKQKTQSKRRIFDKARYDELIDWGNLAKTSKTIYDTMNPELKETLEGLLNNREQPLDETIKKIKKYINCNSGEKNALMRFIFEIEKLGIDVSKYYPKEYDEYIKIKDSVIDSRKTNGITTTEGEEPEAK